MQADKQWQKFWKKLLIFEKGTFRKIKKCPGKKKMVHSAGVEPTTFAVGGQHSIQLRYGCITNNIIAQKSFNVKAI